MPEENELNTLRQAGRDPRMVAFKPMGERGPTVYRDMEGIESSHSERLNNLFRRPPAQLSISEATSSSNLGVPPRHHNAANIKPRAPVSEISLAYLVHIAAALRRGAAKIERDVAYLMSGSAITGAPAYLSDVLHGLLHPVAGDINLQSAGDPLDRPSSGNPLFPFDLDDGTKGKTPVSKWADKIAQDLKRSVGEPLKQPKILVDPDDSDLPIKFVRPLPPVESGNPPTFVSEEDDTLSLLRAELERKEQETSDAAIRKLLQDRLKGLGQPVPTYEPKLMDPRDPNPPPPWPPELRRGAGILGPWPIFPGGMRIGLWGGASGEGVAGGAFIDPDPFFRIWLGGTVTPGQEFPGFEVGLRWRFP
ncbi:MAG: hypothetical protein IT461_15230 [Planctomycetes bacterium]|nr:hypothetical protein [Planctomycetota bacterium]